MALSLAAVDFVFLSCAVFPAYAPSYEARERPAYALQQLSIYGAIIVLLGYSQSSFLVESQPSFFVAVTCRAAHYAPHCGLSFLLSLFLALRDAHHLHTYPLWQDSVKHYTHDSRYRKAGEMDAA